MRLGSRYLSGGRRHPGGAPLRLAAKSRAIKPSLFLASTLIPRMWALVSSATVRKSLALAAKCRTEFRSSFEKERDGLVSGLVDC